MGNQGDALFVTITGINTDWGQETGTFWTVFSQNSETTIPATETVLSTTALEVAMDIPYNQPLGSYDVWRGDLIIENAFTVGCNDPSVMGCHDPSACNDNPLATCGNGTCTYPGCTDQDAWNFNADAACEDGTCWYVPGCMDAAACNYDPLADFDTGDCGYSWGCIDPLATNYNDSATCGDDSCIYEGCTDATACNYFEQAAIDNGSCLYGISGTVYNDVDESGYQSAGSEFGLENWTLHIAPIDLTAFTGSNGFYSIALPPGTYTVTATPPSAAWEAVNSSSYELTTGSCSDVDFPFVATSTDWGVQTSIFHEEPHMHCSNGYTGGLWVNNTGTTALTAAMYLDFPTGLEVVATNPAGAVISAGNVMWTGQTISSGESGLYTATFAGPGVESIGLLLPFEYGLTTLGPDGEPFSQTQSEDLEVLCAYDPNDKQTVPIGYADAHFILQGDRLEYKVRFQNTGNFPAEDIVVRDTLSAHLDWSTFCPMYASHTMTTLFEEETGAIAFCFDNIWLPDSVNNEADSHGYLVFEVDSKSDLLPNDLIENTAHIFFDANPAIVTNTTWHTVFDCAWLESIDAPEEACLGDEFLVNSATDFAESVTWTVNGITTEGGLDLAITAGNTGPMSISAEAHTPLCSAITTTEVHVWDVPEAVIAFDGTLLSVATGLEWQWYLNGTAIDGATDANYAPAESGAYTVWISDQNDCSAVSDAFDMLIDDVADWGTIDFALWRNPGSSHVWIAAEKRGTVVVYNALGERVLTTVVVPGKQALDVRGLAPGVYLVQLEGAAPQLGLTLLIE